MKMCKNCIFMVKLYKDDEARKKNKLAMFCGLKGKFMSESHEKDGDYCEKCASMESDEV